MDKLKIVRISPINSNSQKYLLYKYPFFSDLSYQEQMDIFSSQGFTYGSGFSKAMCMLGYQAIEIVYDLKPMQKRWAKENSINFFEDTWAYDILIAQLRVFQPDIVYFQGDANVLPKKELNRLKEIIPSIQILLIHLAFPLNPQDLSCMDHVFAGYPILYQSYYNSKLPVSLLYHGFDHHILECLPEVHKIIPFSFTGTSGYNWADHTTRYWALKRLLKTTPMQAFIHEPDMASPPQSKASIMRSCIVTGKKIPQVMRKGGDYRKAIPYIHRIKKHLLKKVENSLNQKIVSLKIDYSQFAQKTDSPEYDRLFEYIKPDEKLSHIYPSQTHFDIYGIDMYKMIASSHLTFQIGTSKVTYQNSGAMRIFEAPGVRTALITEETENITDLYVPDKEIILYHSIDDCVKKVQYFLEDPDELVRIGIAGQKRVLTDHTTLKRCRQVDKIIKTSL